MKPEEKKQKTAIMKTPRHLETTRRVRTPSPSPLGRGGRGEGQSQSGPAGVGADPAAGVATGGSSSW